MKKILLILLLLSSYHERLKAQDAPNANAKKSTAGKKTSELKHPQKKAGDFAIFSKEPFDTNVDSLPIAYRGHSCIEISKRLKSFKLEKDEFEATKAYAERVEHVKTEVLYGGLSGSSILSFSPDKPMLIPRYDADTETMNVRILSHGNRSTKVEGNFYASGLINSELSNSRNYMGENGYGKKVEIRSTAYEVCGITFINISSISRSVVIPSEFSFKISSDDARANKGAIGVLYIATLNSPFIARYGDYAKPTMDSPIEIVWSGDSIVTRLSQVWLFSTKTGQIFSKETL